MATGNTDETTTTNNDDTVACAHVTFVYCGGIVASLAALDLNDLDMRFQGHALSRAHIKNEMK